MVNITPKLDLEIKEIIAKHDRRWPIEIMLVNDQQRWPKGYKVSKIWMDQFYVNWTDIIDHLRRLGEILIENKMCQHEYPENVQKAFGCESIAKDLNFGDNFVVNLFKLYNSSDEKYSKIREMDGRMLISQPYNYSHDGLEKLEKYCKEHNLKIVRRWISPYYIGAQLIVIFEDDPAVEKFVNELLKIQDEKYGSDPDERSYIKRK